VLLLLAGAAASGQTATAHTFHVFLRGNEVGTEEVTLVESADGWTLRGSARLGAPLNLKIDYWEARYDRGWKPLELVENLAESNDKWTVHTVFNGTTASSDVALNRSRSGPDSTRTMPAAANVWSTRPLYRAVRGWRLIGGPRGMRSPRTRARPTHPPQWLAT